MINDSRSLPRNWRSLGLCLVSASLLGLSGVEEALASYPSTAWPATWTPYTNLASNIYDPDNGDPDPSHGTSSTPAAIDIVAIGTDSVAYAFSTDGSDQILYFRLRLDEDPRKSGALDQYSWHVLLDNNGDAFTDYNVALDGKNNEEGLYVYWQDSLQESNQNFGYDATCASSTNTEDRTLFIPISDSRFFGTWRVVPVGADDFYLDFQAPLAFFFGCDGSALTADTPFSMTFSTSASAQDPTQKDLVASGDTFSMNGSTPLPFRDIVTFDGGPQQEPAVASVSGACTTNTLLSLQARVLDTLAVTGSTTVGDTIASVTFQYRPQGTSSTSWTDILPALTDESPETLLTNPWATTWDVSGLAAGTYFVRVSALDDQSNTGVSTRNTDFLRVDLGSGSCTVTTTPVTVSYFRALRAGEGVRFDWSTATEVGNVGFNLYHDPEAPPLNAELIPSLVVDSLERQDYRFSVPYVPGDAFWLEDVDIRGNVKKHGPFLLGGAYGQRNEKDPIDWAAVRAESEAKAEVRALRDRRPRGRQAAPEVEARLLVREEGIYRVTYEDLLAAGFDFSSASPQSLALESQGEPVPAYVYTSGNKGFGPGSYVEFVGHGVDTLYTDANVYALRSSAGKAFRVAVKRSGIPKQVATHYMATCSVEQNTAYSFASPTGDPWYQTSLLGYAGRPMERNFSIEVDNYAPGAASAQLLVHLWGVTDWPARPDHHVVIDLNGQQVADERLDGLADWPVHVSLSEGALYQGSNLVTLRLPADAGVAYDMVNLEGFSVTYPRSFEARNGALNFASDAAGFRVSGLTSPNVVVYQVDGDKTTRIDGVTAEASGDGSWQAVFAARGGAASYFVAGADALLAPEIAPPRTVGNITEGEADLLVISHADFLDGLWDLIAAREAEGLRVRLVDVRDVYERFGDGLMDARPIRAYIDYAVTSMGVQYVLLVGGDSYDYRNYTGKQSLSFVPSLYAQTDPIVRWAPVDPLYGDVDRDGVPDVPVGRFPVRTDAELQNLVAKTLVYGTKPYAKTAVFAADQFDASQGISFRDASEGLIGQLPGDWDVQAAYIDEAGVAPARDILITAINLGVALTSYIGHSGATVWSFQGLFNTAHAQALQNPEQPTLVTQWGCWNTYYVSPTNNTMAHKLLLSGLNGAAAVLGATTLTKSSSEEALGKLLLPRLVEPGMRVGDAMVAAKRELAATRPDDADVLLGVALLGDPTLVVEP